jgi:hypothetical protein
MPFFAQEAKKNIESGPDDDPGGLRRELGMEDDEE